MVDLDGIPCAIQSGRHIPGQDVVLYLHKLEDLDVRFIENVKGIFFLEKGANSHAEVICRIKGIPLHRVERLDYIQDSWTLAPARVNSGFTNSEEYQNFPGSFQAAVFDESDLAGLDLKRVETIFVRAEHLMYKAVVEDPEICYRRDLLSHWMSSSLARIVDKLPDVIQVVLRGIDIRSDDPVLGQYLFDSVEKNPELGNHGMRYLSLHPEWVECMASAVAPFETRVSFACPFVTSHAEFESFAHRYESLFRNEIIPFAESPAIFDEIDRYQVRQICLGLKDIAQFYFALDRGVSDVPVGIDYQNPGLVSAIVRALKKTLTSGFSVSLYQDPQFFQTYARNLRNLQWQPSMAAHELKEPDYRR
ncbi:putative PEP-binding protein [Streptomyces massasporeus]|uniref:PEP-binding protein n=1 Tax=Streptomyces massasporeus TaxID=67324 RepID=A0ABW6LCG5_9ACTN